MHIEPRQRAQGAPQRTQHWKVRIIIPAHTSAGQAKEYPPKCDIVPRGARVGLRHARSIGIKVIDR
jgi:hypothetical protein